MMILWFRALLACLLVLAFAAALPAAQDFGESRADDIVSAMRNTVNLHPGIRSRLDELAAIGLDLEAEKARRYPSLSLQAQALTNDQSQVFARIQQPLWVGGRIDGAIDRAGMRLRSGQAALLVLQRQLMEDTASTYAIAVGYRQRLTAAEQNVHEHEKLLGLISRRQAGSIASEADVRLARSRLALAAAQKEQLNGQLNKARTDLQALTQEPVGELLPIPETVMALPDFAGIVADVVKASATVRQRQAEVEVVRADVVLRRADVMPSLYARFDQDIYSNNGIRELPVETKAGVVLEGNIEGAGLAGWKRIKSADARVEAALKEVENARNDARRRAQALLAETESQQKVMQSNELLVTATEETLVSFMRQYDAGRKTWVDVLNAQRELSEARLALEQTRSSFQENSLRLAVQLGSLDSSVGIQR